MQGFSGTGRPVHGPKILPGHGPEWRTDWNGWPGRGAPLRQEDREEIKLIEHLLYKFADEDDAWGDYLKCIR